MTGFVAVFTAQTMGSLHTWYIFKVLTKSSTSPPSSSSAASSFALSLGARNYKQESDHDNRMITFVCFDKKTTKTQEGSETQGLGLSSLVSEQEG